MRSARQAERGHTLVVECDAGSRNLALGRSTSGQNVSGHYAVWADCHSVAAVTGTSDRRHDTIGAAAGHTHNTTLPTLNAQMYALVHCHVPFMP